MSKIVSRFRQILEWGIYFGLMIYCYFVVSNSLDEYMEGRTSFRTHLEPLTYADQPTFTVCFDHIQTNGLVYGEDFYIAVILEEADTSLFLEIQTGDGYQEHGNSTHRYSLQLLTTGNDCFKISQVSAHSHDSTSAYLPSDELKADAPENYDLSKFSVFIFMFFDKTRAPKEATLYVTSEANAYGAVFGNGGAFNEGVVNPITLKKGVLFKIEVVEVKLFEFIEETCVKESHYQCLAAKLNQTQTCSQYGPPCSLLSLPTSEHIRQFPPCDLSKHGQSDCNYRVLMDLFKRDCRGKHEVSCKIKEFEVIDDEKDEEPKDLGNFLFSYSFGRKMLSVRGERIAGQKQGNVYKTVHHQYYIYTSFALVGNIGGTLGLLIGFSFSGSITWVIDVAIRLCQCLGKRNQPLTTTRKETELQIGTQ